MMATFHVTTAFVTIATVLPGAMIATMTAMAVIDVYAHAARTHSDTHALRLCNRSHRANAQQRRDGDTHDSKRLH
jgi:hypothetical protein